MNAPDRLALGSVLGTLSMSHAPVIDRHRRMLGTRLTMLSSRPQDRLPVGRMLQPLGLLWPGTRAPVLLALLDAEFDDSLLDWAAPANAILEVPAIGLRDPFVQALVQRAHRRRIRLAMRGRPDVPLPPALLGCFEYALIHVSEDRRRRSDGSNAPPPPGVTRRMPFIITGEFRHAELDAAYARGAIGSVGVPFDEVRPTLERPPQPGHGSVLQLLRLAHERADFDRMEAVVRRDAALMFELLRFVGEAASAVPIDASATKRALTALGHASVVRWISRLLRVASDEGSASPLMHGAIRRALFLEQLSACAPGAAELADALYLTGAFSLLDRATGTSFERLFQRAALPAAARQALVERAGPCAPYLGLAEAAERSDPLTLRRQREALGIDALDCNLSLLRALCAAPAPGCEDDPPSA